MSTEMLETMPVPVRALVTGTIKEDVNWVLAKQSSFDQSIYSIAEFGKALLSLHLLTNGADQTCSTLKDAYQSNQ